MKIKLAFDDTELFNMLFDITNLPFQINEQYKYHNKLVIKIIEKTPNHIFKMKNNNGETLMYHILVNGHYDMYRAIILKYDDFKIPLSDLDQYGNNAVRVMYENPPKNENEAKIRTTIVEELVLLF